MSISTCCPIFDAEPRFLRAATRERGSYCFVPPKTKARLAAASLSAATCSRSLSGTWQWHRCTDCAGGGRLPGGMTQNLPVGSQPKARPPTERVRKLTAQPPGAPFWASATGGRHFQQVHAAVVNQKHRESRSGFRLAPHRDQTNPSPESFYRPYMYKQGDGTFRPAF